MTLAQRHPELMTERVRGVAFVSTSAGPALPRLRRSRYFSDRFVPSALVSFERDARKERSERFSRIWTRGTMFGYAPNAAT